MYVLARRMIYGFGNGKSLPVDRGNGSGLTLSLIVFVVDSAPARVALRVYSMSSPGDV